MIMLTTIEEPKKKTPIDELLNRLCSDHSFVNNYGVFVRREKKHTTAYIAHRKNKNIEAFDKD